MSKASELADQAEAANAELIAAVDQCSEAEWQKTSSAEGWTVGVLAHHVAISYQPIAEMVVAVANDVEPSVPTQDEQHARNASHAVDYKDVSRDDVVALLRQNGSASASAIRGLQDEQLAKTTTSFGGQEMSAEALINAAVIGHTKQHLGSIQGAIRG